MRDEGFNMPDIRNTFFSGGERVTVTIQRHWFTPEEEDDVDFKVSFNIARLKDNIKLPVGIDESVASEIAHKIYQQTAEDIEDTEFWNNTEAMEAAERRMGA